MNTKKKPTLLRSLGLQRSQALIKNGFLAQDDFFAHSESSEEDEDEINDEDETLLNFIGHMELYTIVWPTVLGTLDCEEIGSNIYARGELKIPSGTILLINQFNYPVRIKHH